LCFLEDFIVYGHHHAKSLIFAVKGTEYWPEFAHAALRCPLELRELIEHALQDIRDTFIHLYQSVCFQLFPCSFIYQLCYATEGREVFPTAWGCGAGVQTGKLLPKYPSR
jgi:hypothetical protein